MKKIVCVLVWCGGMMLCVDVVEMFICLCEFNLYLKIELEYSLLFELLVVVVLLVQVIDVGVNKVMC